MSLPVRDQRSACILIARTLPGTLSLNGDHSPCIDYTESRMERTFVSQDHRLSNLLLIAYAVSAIDHRD